eukprot:scaffold20.g7811.t1
MAFVSVRPFEGRCRASASSRSVCLSVRVQCTGDRQQERAFGLGQAAAAAALAVALAAGPAHARLEGVNRPELLPPGPVTTVIDVAGSLTDGEEARIRQRVAALERDTGVKLRQGAGTGNYPETPGLAIKEYWGVDADTVVFVADPNTGNILNFNVGENVDLKVPRNFWSRLAGRFGTKRYWQTQGQDVAIINAVAGIDNCLREPCLSILGVLE